MTIAEKVLRAKTDYDEVYDAGYAKGQAEGGGDGGYDEGYADGVGNVWGNMQNQGNRTDYRAFFMGTAFVYLNPQFLVRASNADNIMSNCANLESVNWEMFDLSSASSLYNAFGFCQKLKSIDTDLAVVNGTATLLNSVCRNCTSLVRVQKITAFPAAVWKNSFDNCTELVDITFDGTIGADGLDVHWSTKLNKASITSVINALSADTTGFSVALSLVAVKKAFETSEGANDGNASDEWTALVATKPNWTISLA